MTDDHSRIAVTYVTAPACHLCDHGREVLAELAATYPLEIREVALRHHVRPRRQLLADLGNCASRFLTRR